MKKYCLTLAFLSALTTGVFACDICGCGIGNNYIGVLPDFNKHIIGLRYRQNSLLTHVGVGGSSSYLTTHEKYITTELWAGWNIGSAFRVMTSVPYSFNEKINRGNRLSKNGLGDVSVTGFYNLVNNRKTVSDKLLVQSLWMGVGAKAPTGRYNPVDKSNTSENANLFQLGTGSVDLMLTAMYDLRMNDAGISASALYKINTTNKYEYDYGNKFSTNAQFYYKFRIRKMITLAPNAGFGVEKAARDSDRKMQVDVSGGSLFLGTLGTEMTFKNISAGGSYQRPLSQNLANGIVKANDRFMIHLSLLL